MEDIEALLSVIYHALRAPRRRYVIEILATTDQRTMTTRDLARRISGIEHNLAREEATGEPYRNVYNALSQTHLPTLADSGIIIYDRDRQRTISGPNLDITALLIETNTPTVDLFSMFTDSCDEDDGGERNRQ